MAKTLTKRDLVNKISAETNFTQIEVFDIVQRAVDIISSTLAEGDRVVIRNFGTFQVKEVKPKVGRNPKNPDQDVPIPARSVVKIQGWQGIEGSGRQADRLQVIPTGIRQITPGASIKQWRRLFVCNLRGIREYKGT